MSSFVGAIACLSFLRVVVLSFPLLFVLTAVLQLALAHGYHVTHFIPFAWAFFADTT